MNVSALPILFISRRRRQWYDSTHTSANLAMSGLPTAMMIACAVVRVPDSECFKTVEVLQSAVRKLEQERLTRSRDIDRLSSLASVQSKSGQRQRSNSLSKE
jgi:predicted secreted Zn-dependent protease